MAYKSKDKHWTRRFGFLAVVFVIAGVVFVLARSNDDNDSGPRVPVYGTTEDSGFVDDEEVGVFEDSTAVVVEASDPPTTAPAPAATPAKSAPARARTRASTAIPKYEAALAQRKGDPLLLNNYAWSLHLAGRYPEAESALREVIQNAPNRAIAFANLGETLWKQGKNEEAAAMYRKFLEMNTDPRRERIAEGKLAAITSR